MDTSKLTGHVPDSVLEQVPDASAMFSINTNLRLAHFLAQCAHESDDFTANVENLNYGAAALKSVFHKYFPTDELAIEYARHPEAIANVVYANRMGNGNTASGDGWKFRGRGYIQLTGKSNYAAFGKSIGVDIVSNPDLVATTYPLLSAAWFWNNDDINAEADKGFSDVVVTLVTKIVNGGTNGLPERLAFFKKYWNLLNS